MYDLNQIAALTGLSKNYVRDKLTKRPDFPSPDIRLSQKIKWWKPETEEAVKNYLALAKASNEEAVKNYLALAKASNEEAVKNYLALAKQWQHQNRAV